MSLLFLESTMWKLLPLLSAARCSPTSLSVQTSTPSGSSPGRTASTPSTSSSTAATSQEVPSRSEWENQDKPESPVWSGPTVPVWREAPQVRCQPASQPGSLPASLLQEHVLQCFKVVPSHRLPVRVHHQQHQGGSRVAGRVHRGSVQGEDGLPGGSRGLQGALHPHGSWNLPHQYQIRGAEPHQRQPIQGQGHR